LGGAANNPLWRNTVLRRDCLANRVPRRISGRRVGEWPQSDRHHRAVPSGDRVQWQPYWIWRRTRSKKGFARIGEKPDGARAIRLNNGTKMPLPSNRNWRAEDLNCVRRCPTFPPVLGSIIGAGRLSFRVRDGSGRFPAAMDRRNFIHLLKCPLVVGILCEPRVFGGGVWMLVRYLWIVVARFVCKFSAG
jgi:hypothetical protein